MVGAESSPLDRQGGPFEQCSNSVSLSKCASSHPAVESNAVFTSFCVSADSPTSFLLSDLFLLHLHLFRCSHHPQFGQWYLFQAGSLSFFQHFLGVITSSRLAYLLFPALDLPGVPRTWCLAERMVFRDPGWVPGGPTAPGCLSDTTGKHMFFCVSAETGVHAWKSSSNKTRGSPSSPV